MHAGCDIAAAGSCMEIQNPIILQVPSMTDASASQQLESVHSKRYCMQMYRTDVRRTPYHPCNMDMRQ